MDSLASDAVRRRVLHTIPVAVYLAVSLPHLDLVPMWDGFLYATCLSRIDSLSAFLAGCCGHSTLAWSAPMLPAFLAFPGSAAAINLTQIALGAAGIVAFQRLLASLWPERSAAAINTAVATAFATDPVLVGNLLNLTPDNGVLVYYLFFLMFLVRRQCRAAAAAGVLLVLSKETGLAYYIVTTLAWMIWRRYRTTEQSSWRELLRESLILALPLAVFAGATLTRQLILERQAWIGFRYSRDLVAEVLPNLDDAVFLRLLAAIFVMNFAWLSSALIVGDGVRRGFGRLRQRSSRVTSGADRPLGAIAVMLGLFAWLSTRLVVGHASPRYIIICLPLVALALRDCLASIPSWRVRVIVPCVIVALHLASLDRSIDPVSKLALGSFSVGEREMYRTTAKPWDSRNGAEGLQRDELVYSLEYTKLHRLFDWVLENHCSAACPLLTNFNRGAHDFGITLDGVSRRALPGKHAPSVCQDEAVRFIRSMQNSENYDRPSSACLVYVGFPHTRPVDAFFDQRIAEWGYRRTALDTVAVDGFVAEVSTYSKGDPTP